MKKILVAGSITVDLIFQSYALESRQIGNRWSLAHGGKYLVDYYDLALGGGGANAAVCLADIGLETWLFSQMGTDSFTPAILANLKKHKVKTALIKQLKNKNATSAIIIDKTGDRTIFNYRSANDRLLVNNLVKKALKQSSWVAIYSLPYWQRSKKLAFLKLTKLEKKHLFLSLHGTEYKQGFNYLKSYLRLADIVHMNAYEMADLMQDKVEKMNFYQENFAKILDIPLVLVTYDTKGSFAYTKDKIYHQTIVKPKKIVDTTGAGDAFSASFLGIFIKTGDISKSLSFAARNASSVIEHFGAQNGLLKV